MNGVIVRQILGLVGIYYYVNDGVRGQATCPLIFCKNEKTYGVIIGRSR